jgi:DNA-binding CsgD family transcriptional regulator/PAS domain-containing protein
LALDETLLSAIDELYAGALDAARLTSSLGHVSRIAGANGGVIYLMHEGERRMTHRALSNFDLNSRGKFDGVLAEQGHYYRRMPLGTPIHMHKVWPIEAMKNSEFYQEVLGKQDVLYGAGTLLLRRSGLHGMIVLNRSERAGPFTGRHFDVLRVLAPHLNRVLRITLKVNTIACEREMFVSALDSLSVGVIFADSRGKALHLNQAAERMIATNDGLGLRSGRVVAAEANEDSMLTELMANATGDGRYGQYRRGGSCRLTRSEGLPWLLLVAPCSETAAHAFAPLSPACMIFIHDPAARSSTTSEQLRHLFGLTGQESKISMLAAEGRGIAHVADEVGLSALTVRNHLQRAFEKTGTSRQAELARLIASLSIEAAQKTNAPHGRHR